MTYNTIINRLPPTGQTQNQKKMNIESIRNEFADEFAEMCDNTISALNGLMQTREVCKASKAVTKINRFKQWVIELQDNLNDSEK